MSHDGGFTCAQVDAGSQHMAASISRLREERAEALRAYDAEVIGRREEVTRLHAELGRVRAELSHLQLTQEALAERVTTSADEACGLGPVMSPDEQLTRIERKLFELRMTTGRSMRLLEACRAIPDITISKWACDPGGPWNVVREVLRAQRTAQGLDVDAADPETAFDDQGWLKQRASEAES